MLGRYLSWTSSVGIAGGKNRKLVSNLCILCQSGVKVREANFTYNLWGLVQGQELLGPGRRWEGHDTDCSYL